MFIPRVSGNIIAVANANVNTAIPTAREFPPITLKKGLNQGVLKYRFNDIVQKVADNESWNCRNDKGKSDFLLYSFVPKARDKAVNVFVKKSTYGQQCANMQRNIHQ